MDSKLLNKLLKPLEPTYVPINSTPKPVGPNQVSIVRIRNDHWVTLIPALGAAATDKKLIIDSELFQRNATCGLFSIVAVLAFKVGGSKYVNELFHRQFSTNQSQLIENELVCLNLIKQWIRRLLYF